MFPVPLPGGRDGGGEGEAHDVSRAACYSYREGGESFDTSRRDQFVVSWKSFQTKFTSLHISVSTCSNKLMTRTSPWSWWTGTS